MSTVLAFDFGASSGRAIKAVYNGGEFSYTEIHRFENTPIEKNGHLYWDFPTLLSEVKKAIEKAGKCDSIGFDTWGVDFGLLDANNNLIELPVHYRDVRTQGIPEEVQKTISNEDLYRASGNQIMNINTLFQLIAAKQKTPEVFKKAKKMLFMPDLFAFSLSGKMACEYTIASTSQMLNMETAKWDESILKSFDIDSSLFAPFVPTGTITGSYNGMKIIAVAGHDTQCAVAAMPAKTHSPAFLSCGTWSLLGTELDSPILSKNSMESALSNEYGANGKINYLKNIIGLWLIQESRREWKRQGNQYSFGDLEEMAEKSQPLTCFIDPDDPDFVSPGDIPTRIRDFCKKTGQRIPETPGEITRCINESLALKYRLALEQLSSMTGKKFDVLHILGGGAKSAQLCQFTADCSGLSVIAGPSEATALGNIMIQLVSLGDIANIDAGRKLIAEKESVIEYTPHNTEEWNEQFAKYKKAMQKK